MILYGRSDPDRVHLRSYHPHKVDDMDWSVRRESMFRKQGDPELGTQVSLNIAAWSHPDALLAVMAKPLSAEDLSYAIRSIVFYLLTDGLPPDMVASFSQCKAGNKIPINQVRAWKMWTKAHTRPIASYSHPFWGLWIHEVGRVLALPHQPQQGKPPLP